MTVSQGGQPAGALYNGLLSHDKRDIAVVRPLYERLTQEQREGQALPMWLDDEEVEGGSVVAAISRGLELSWHVVLCMCRDARAGPPPAPCAAALLRAAAREDQPDHPLARQGCAVQRGPSTRASRRLDPLLASPRGRGDHQGHRPGAVPRAPSHRRLYLGRHVVNGEVDGRARRGRLRPCIRVTGTQRPPASPSSVLDLGLRQNTDAIQIPTGSDPLVFDARPAVV